LPAKALAQRPPDWPEVLGAAWLYRWLLFRLRFASGLAKLLSGDPSWRDVSALSHHFEAQPLGGSDWSDLRPMATGRLRCRDPACYHLLQLRRTHRLAEKVVHPRVQTPGLGFFGGVGRQRDDR